MLQKKKPRIKSRGVKTFEQNEDVYIFLVLSKYHIFLFCTALQKLQKIVTCFPEDELVFESSVIVVMSLSVVLGVKRWISKSYSHCWKGFKYTKMLENQRICGTAEEQQTV